VADQRRGRVHLERQHLALDRTHRHPRLLRQAGDLARPGAGGQHRDGAFMALVAKAQRRDPAGGDFHRLTARMFVQLAAGCQEGALQRAHQKAVVGLMIARAEHRGGERGIEARLALARLLGRQPFERHALGALEVVQ
jgi:hypothetical protein